jgi:polar amino acid transport system permease protein
MSWLTPKFIILLLEGVIVTIFLTAITSILSLLVGVGVGTMRLSPRPWLHWLAGIFVDIFRNIPALVLIIFFAFAVPNAFPLLLRQELFFNNDLAAWAKQISGLSLPSYALAAIVGLTLNSSAYIAELFRAGVGTIPQEYVDAARSLGAGQTAVFKQIILPQGFRAAFPAIETRLIHNMKNSALVSFVAVPDFFLATQTAINKSFRATQFLLLATAVYLILSVSYAALLRQIEHRLNRQSSIVNPKS